MEAETRAIALALVNATGTLSPASTWGSGLTTLGNLASTYGSYIFPADDAPKYLMGFGVISALLGVGVTVYILMNIFVRRRKS